MSSLVSLSLFRTGGTYPVWILGIQILLDFHSSLICDFHPMTRHQFPDTTEDGAIIHHPSAIDNAASVSLRSPAHRQECLGLGGEEDLIANNSPQDGLDAKPISNGDDATASLSLIKQYKGKFAA